MLEAIAAVATAIVSTIFTKVIKDKKLQKQIKEGSGLVSDVGEGIESGGKVVAKTAKAVEQGKISAKDVKNVYKNGQDVASLVNELVSDDDVEEKDSEEK